MKTLHITNHVGTQRNIENVFYYLGLSDDLETQKIHTHPFIFVNGIHYGEIQNIWENGKDKIKDYECLFFSDTIMYALPFLLNIEQHDLKIIIYITNRFDFLIICENTRQEYADLFTRFSKNPRVFFCSDNRYDQYYASLYGLDFYYDDLIRLTPMIDESENNTSTIVNHDKVFIYNRGNQIEKYQSFLFDHEINFEIFGEGYKRYENEKEISQYLGYFHLPYQTNIQSLWENLGFSILYFIPSKMFMKELVVQPWYYFEEKYFMEGKKNRENLLNQSIELAEWYQPENEDFFEYFDSWSQLKDKLEEYKKDEKKRIEKRKRIREKIKVSNLESLEKWKKIMIPE
jgi:hypothetical protein